MISGSRRRAMMAAAVMFAGSAAGTLGRPSKHLADQVGVPDLSKLFPEHFRDWRADTTLPVIMPSPDVQALLDKIYNETLARTYVNADGERIMLSVAYGGDQSDGTSAHRPEVCYPAQGFAINSNRAATFRFRDYTFPVRRLTSALGTRHEPITYWVIVGRVVVTTGLAQKWAQMQYGLRGVIPDGMLIRVSSIDGDSSHAFHVQDGFISELLTHMTAADRVRVIGG